MFYETIPPVYGWWTRVRVSTAARSRSQMRISSRKPAEFFRQKAIVKKVREQNDTRAKKDGTYQSLTRCAAACRRQRNRDCPHWPVNANTERASDGDVRRRMNRRFCAFSDVSFHVTHCDYLYCCSTIRAWIGCGCPAVYFWWRRDGGPLKRPSHPPAPGHGRRSAFENNDLPVRMIHTRNDRRTNRGPTIVSKKLIELQEKK